MDRLPSPGLCMAGNGQGTLVFSRPDGEAQMTMRPV